MNDEPNISNHDVSILVKIITYCDEITETKKVLGASKEALSGSFIYRNSVAMDVLQIGKLATVLTNEFKASHSGVPWREIIKMRHLAAHHYGDFRTELLWETITNDIDPLREYCAECIKGFNQ